MKKMQVWGVGNILLGDDAAGCRVAELLREAGETGVTDCGTTPENYVATLRKNPPRTLLIVDAADMKLPPGECRLLTLGETESTAGSSHGIPLSLLLAPFEETTEIFALAIQPEFLFPGTPLSAAVKKATDHVADLILKDEWRTIPRMGE